MCYLPIQHSLLALPLLYIWPCAVCPEHGLNDYLWVIEVGSESGCSSEYYYGPPGDVLPKFLTQSKPLFCENKNMYAPTTCTPPRRP